LIKIDTFDAAVRKSSFVFDGKRRIIGIVGKPGSGKSTLAHALVNVIGDHAELLPMDGFHLSNAVLRDLGIADRKGAPHTFDVDGYSDLLKRVREDFANPVYFPVFDRGIEESIAAQGVIKPTTQLVITEGNYLLLQAPGWEKIRPLLDEIWYVDVDDELRLERLIARHIHYGRSPVAAKDWALGTDELNAQLVGECRERADVVIELQSPALQHPIQQKT
jgi:pantothenate kinase